MTPGRSEGRTICDGPGLHCGLLGVDMVDDGKGHHRDPLQGGDFLADFIVRTRSKDLRHCDLSTVVSARPARLLLLRPWQVPSLVGAVAADRLIGIGDSF